LEISSLPSSFRDPSGFLFKFDGIVYRQVHQSYKQHYDKLISSSLYESLIAKNWLIPHEEVGHPDTQQSVGEYYKILRPEQIPYISYPYEWCTSQLRDAAILTLNIQLEALKFGMTLKDASAYNVQFHKGKPVFIDTLSFEIYEEGKPWIAYRQFCQHFLAPLALIVRCDHRLAHLLKSYVDGVPLDLASKLLPARSWLSYSLLAHVHFHAKAQKQFEDSGKVDSKKKAASISKLQLEGLVSSLLSAISKLDVKYSDTEWGDYYSDTNYGDISMCHKQEVIVEFLKKRMPSSGELAADFGANTGKFSRLAIDAGYHVIAHDIDAVAVDKNYRSMVAEGEDKILPLILDLTNPSPGLGWANKERSAFIGRRKVDVGMALALIHHIAISNNIPLEYTAELFSSVCKFLIIEFVPKADSQVKRLLATRQDIFPEYTEAGFEKAFRFFFNIVERVSVKDSERTLYYMESIKG
jgi:hypothetical protein